MNIPYSATHTWERINQNKVRCISCGYEMQAFATTYKVNGISQDSIIWQSVKKEYRAKIISCSEYIMDSALS